MFAAWPVFIYLSYLICAWAISKYEKNNNE